MGCNCDFSEDCYSSKYPTVFLGVSAMSPASQLDWIGYQTLMSMPSAETAPA